ncbi:MAG: CRR6 family NdhI maturation factor [Synechococcus sp.]
MATPSAAEEPLLRIPSHCLRGLDLAPLAPWRERPAQDLLAEAGRLHLHYEWPREAEDPRELSEIPELRLWTLRADALCPWLPLLLERSSGELTRHVAMLLPHGFSRSEGIRFAPESLELWITHRIFLLDDWAQRAGAPCRQGLSQMAAVLGFELDPGFWEALPPAGAGPSAAGPG